MKKQKLLGLLVAAAIPGVSAIGDIALSDNLSVRGLLDARYMNDDQGGGTELESLHVETFDIDFLFDTEKVEAEIHLNATEANGHSAEIEQAFINYDLGNGFGLTAGRYYTLLGYERDETYDLFQPSYAYNIGGSGKNPFGGYHSGVKANYASDSFSASISVVDGVRTADEDAEDLGFEAQVKFTGLENLVLAIGTAQDDQDALAGIDQYWNFFVEYNGFEKFVLAAEMNNYELAEMDATSWMAMANYAATEKCSLTLRYSEIDEDSGPFEADKFTIAPSYSITDNLLGRVEYSFGEENGTDVEYLALQVLWTF